jgi:hypothetical protein
MGQRRRVVIALLAVAALVVVASSVRFGGSSTPVAAETLPARVSDQEFWRLITDFSEPNGFFRSDNFLSNELEYQWVVPTLTSTLGTGGVYLGVGPEQNFTYMVALRPKLAFIVDIRRGNLDEHLLYKAFIEMSADRADFLSRLFARPRPAGLQATTDVDALFAAYESAPPSETLFEQNLQAATDWLVGHHKFTLLDQDVKGLEYVYRAFFEGGPDLNYSFPGGPGGPGGFGGFGGSRGFGRGNFPTYAELMTATDGHGEHRSYLASEDQFRTLGELEKNNAIIPIVGNFAGPKALRAVGSYLRAHNATVSAFYTSNVEMYLFQQADDWQKFYGNVATLPVGDKSQFIRSVSGRGARFQSRSNVPGARSSTRLSPIADLLRAFRAGRIGGYYDVIAMSR